MKELEYRNYRKLGDIIFGYYHKRGNHTNDGPSSQELNGMGSLFRKYLDKNCTI